MDNEKLWKSVLSELEIQISRPNFLTWMKNSNLVEKTPEGEVIIGLGNNFTKEWVENKYHKVILETLISFDNSIKKVKYSVSPISTESKPTTVESKKSRPAQATFEEFKIDPETNLHPKYNFKSFIVGSSNELAYAATLAVIKDVGKKYNPLFIYGGTGLGKTHLLQALGNEIKAVYKNKLKVRYVASEKFVNDIISAIRNKRMEDIKEKYRTVDVLIIDDIQFLAGKEKSEEEFFNTFNALYELDKQIIISSDRPPAATPILEERLRSRFSGGMIADISYPDYEMRSAIIKTKLQEKNMSLGDDVCAMIANKIQRNVREIEGVLNKVIFYQEVKNIVVTTKILEEIIGKTVRQSFKNITPNQIMQVVAGFFEISEKEIVEHTRRKEIVEPRQITMFLLKDLLGMSFSDIGNKLGKRDHTTVIHACGKISEKMNTDQQLNNKIILIKEIINNK
ncbi:chromosomal replication initiator protein DnaA [Candidatus Wolfebacteria bacterium CG10_big_fil_rev_8_21_14_0_10_31_9]|uniref:Chromosomal replication initiator protein DnaA n=1 Tax=Candidatus Wolfebacteria bacterium CG10_big_fil_rev_8_21_14_0_10_31_9 TaxID=1975070 RepID=A0A2H0RD24_9BACT|nr:MAG: chromosomal replication initiator protein DnaA [Candidatus Wolfebacteria bacterium CG10_big_fil_rev_8_21_14_0_10_31_9]